MGVPAAGIVPSGHNARSRTVLRGTIGPISCFPAGQPLRCRAPDHIMMGIGLGRDQSCSLTLLHDA